MNFRTLSFSFLLATSFSLILSSSDLQAQSQAEMNQAALSELEATDKELNKVYKQLIAANSGDADFQSNLKKAQRAWLQYVELHLQTVLPVAEGENPNDLYGSSYAADHAAEKTQLFVQRVALLKRML